MTRPKVLVTGGTGSIGQHLIPVLLERGNEVHVTTRSVEKLSSMEWGRKVVPHKTDLWNPDQVRELYETVLPEEIYHLAASLMQWGKNDGNEVLARANILSSVTLMEGLEVLPTARFVYPGSFAELGGKDEPIREDHIPDPQEFYSITKLAGTLEAKQLARNKGYHIIVGRVFTAYGPGMPIERLMGQVLLRALRNDDIVLVAPDITRDFIYAADIAHAFIELAGIADQDKGEIYNVASGQKTSLLALIELIRDITGTKSRVIWQPERRTTYDILPWQADMRKTFGRLAWRPEISLREGILRMITSIERQI